MAEGIQSRRQAQCLTASLEKDKARGKGHRQLLEALAGGQQCKGHPGSRAAKEVNSANNLSAAGSKFFLRSSR